MVENSLLLAESTSGGRSPVCLVFIPTRCGQKPKPAVDVRSHHDRNFRNAAPRWL